MSRGTSVNMQSMGHDTSRQQAAASLPSAGPQVTHATGAYTQSNHDDQELPKAADCGDSKRKRKEHEDTEKYPLKATKRRCAPDQAHINSEASTSMVHGHGNNILLNDDAVSQDQGLSLPTINEHQQDYQQHSPMRSSDFHASGQRCNHFFVRGLRRRGPVQREDAEEIFEYLDDTQNVDDLLAVSAREIFDISRFVIQQFYHSKSEFENLNFQRDTPTGIDFVGKIRLFVIPVLRGDGRPLDFGNPNALPGPYDTSMMYKITPALLAANDHREHMSLKLFTTKHNTDPRTLCSSGRLEKDYVLMRRMRGNDSMDDISCFASLDFVGTSQTYDYKDSFYIEVVPTYAYLRRCPWIEIGHMVRDVTNHNTLDMVLTEAGNRLAAPNREILNRLSANALASPTLSSRRPPAALAPPSRSIFAALSAQDTNTAIHKTLPLPANPDAEPQCSQKTFTTKLPPGIDNLTILECFHKIGATPEQLAFMNDTHTQKLAALRKTISTDTQNRVQSLNADTSAQKGDSTSAS